MVDLLKPEPKPAHRLEKRRMGANGDVEAAEMRNLQWLVSSPKFTQDVIGDDGLPGDHGGARPTGVRPAQTMAEPSS